MENNEIIQRLLQDDKPSKNVKSNVKANKDWNLQVSRIRVVTAKYKVYIVLLLILIFAFILVYIPNEQNSNDSRELTYTQVRTELKNIKASIENAKNDIEYLRTIVEKEQNIKTCLNNDNCSDLPEEWRIWSWENVKYNLNIPLSYLQLHSLYNKKMPVDEKRVLKNLNEYLIKQDIAWEDRKRVWDILKIEIWDPEEVYDWDEHFIKVPVDVEIEFITVDDLIWFLYNVEKKLVDKPEDRILYKIQSVSYDVVSKDEPQDTEISMIAYYYHDEKFDDLDETTAILEINENNDIVENEIDEEIDNTDEWDSFFKGLFKNFKK